MVQEITFQFTPSLMGSYDRPNPPILHNAGVIVIQDGRALVGVWDAEVCGFGHPCNQQDLAAAALNAVLESYPDVDLTSKEERFFTCPESLVNQFDWNWKPPRKS
jgi:hypothetical protein